MVFGALFEATITLGHPVQSRGAQRSAVGLGATALQKAPAFMSAGLSSLHLSLLFGLRVPMLWVIQ